MTFCTIYSIIDTYKYHRGDEMDNKKSKIGMLILLALFLFSLCVNFYCIFFYENYTTYLQDTNEIYIMESGIIEANRQFRDGEDKEIQYDFNHANRNELLKKYNIQTIAGNGSEFGKAVNLMHEYSERLRHESNSELKSEQMDAMFLLDYALDDSEHGINCRAKSQILNEMCLALKIYSRKVWLMPISKYDTDCHVVNEIWDSKLNKWIMLDITNDMYWVDENKTPLSIVEIREKLADQQFCTPISVSDVHSDLKNVLDDNYDNFLYIAKNMVYLEYMVNNAAGESDVYTLMPENLDKPYDFLISEKAVKSPPETK